MAAPGDGPAGTHEEGRSSAFAGDTLRRTGPFALALFLAFAVVPFEHPREHAAPLAVALGLVVALAVTVAAVPWDRVRGWVRVLPVLAVFPIIALLRHAEGGATSEFGPLLMLPLLWLALYATRRELVVGIVLGAATLGLPPLLIGGQEYPPTEWGRVAVFIILAPIAGGVVHDLVRRVRSQSATVETLTGRLALAEESFRAAFVDAPAAQFMCAPSGTLLRVNDAMCTLTGADRDELFGAETADVFDPADALRVNDVLLALWHGEATGPVELEVLVRRRTGGDRVAMLRVDIVRAAADRPLFLLGHALDVTERVAEARDKDVRADVAQAVRAATQQLGTSPDTRRLLCETAVAVCGATTVVLMEDDGAGSLVGTARSGPGRAPRPVHIGRRQSHAATALASHRPILAAGDEAAVDVASAAALGAALFEPILRDGEAVGVLVVGWPQAPEDVPDESLVAAHLLAAETASVLVRADHLGTLEKLAHEDALTGLPNRRMWEERLPGEMARALRDGGPLCVAIIDLDHFKRFNDEHGHQAGDRLLLEAAAAWRARLRRSDVLARHGGEEFAVMLPRCDEERAVALLERLREATPAPATCSIGVAVWDGRETLEELLERADRSLYAAKRAGRNRTLAAPAAGARPQEPDEPVPSGILQHANGDA